MADLPQEDRSGVKPTDIPGLRAREASGGADSDGSSDTAPAPEQTEAADGGSLYNPKDSSRDTANGASSPSALAEAEGGGANSPDALGKGFSAAAGAASPGTRLTRAFNQNRRKALIGGGVGGALIGIVVAVFFLLIPLKIENVVDNLQSHFFATSQNAVDQETNSLFASYVETKVIPGYSHCGTTISKECSALSSIGTNPVSKLFNDWRTSKLENTLATKYNITIEKTGNTWTIKTPGGDADLGPDGKNTVTVLQSNKRGEVRAAVKNGIEADSKYTEVFYRYKVGRLLEEKYGIRRCIIFCGVTDPLQDKVAEQKVAAKLYLTDRVITPRDKTLGVAITCILDSTCDPTKTNPDNTDPALNGEPSSTTEDTIRQNFQQLATQFGVEDAEALEEVYNNISDKGFQSYITEQILSQFVGQETAATATDKIPIVGWINLANQVFKAANDLGPKTKKLAYITNSAAAVDLFMMYSTYADEIHTGHVSATEVGSMVDSLGPGDTTNKTDPEVGGDASAEQSPLYASLIDGGSSTSTTASLLSDVSGSKAYADSTTTPSTSASYTCNNGKPVPAGQQVCAEEVLGQGNSSLDAIHTFFNEPGVNIIKYASDIWSATVGKIFGAANWLVGGVLNTALSGFQKTADATCNVPLVDENPYCGGKALVEKEEPQIMDALTSWLIPDPFSTNMSGGRTFDMMAAGADVAGNDAAHTTLGGQALTPTQTAEITNQQATEAQQNFAQQSFFARMFSTDSPYSLVSRLAMDVPINFQASAQTAFASLISNPFGVLGHSFASIFSHKVSAELFAQSDPFGVTQYGYPDGTIPNDPETYWNQHCSDGADGAQTQAWDSASSGTTDKNTGMPVNTTTDPCLLIQATVGSVGGAADTSLLAPDDLADVGSN